METVSALFQPALLLYTVPALLALSLWLLAVVGLFDFEAFDIDADVEVDADLEAGAGPLQWIGLGLIPLSLVLTLILFFFGATGVGLHAFLGAGLSDLGWSGLAQNLVFAPLALVAGTALAALAARPLRPLFQDYGKARGAAELVGKVAVLKTGTLSPTFGAAIVRLPGGTTVEIATRSYSEAPGLQYGDQVLVIEYDPAKNIYFVEPYEPE